MKLSSQCIRHKRFKTEDIANKELIRVNHKYHNNLQRTYKCHYCQGWHLTSKDNRNTHVQKMPALIHFNIEQHSSGLIGEHDVVLDAIESECLHNA